jgi:hypothetical protein
MYATGLEDIYVDYYTKMLDLIEKLICFYDKKSFNLIASSSWILLSYGRYSAGK